MDETVSDHKVHLSNLRLPCFVRKLMLGISFLLLSFPSFMLQDIRAKATISNNTLQIRENKYRRPLYIQRRTEEFLKHQLSSLPIL